MRSLLEAPSPAVLQTSRANGSALVTPVWFRWSDPVFEVVIADDDVKVRHLEHNPTCALVVFEAVPPFRGVEARGQATLTRCDVTELRTSIAGRYLDAAAGARFATERASRVGVLLTLVPERVRAWDLSAVLPA
jgi:PPOX class probable F420-dependent enzyme